MHLTVVNTGGELSRARTDTDDGLPSPGRQQARPTHEPRELSV